MSVGSDGLDGMAIMAQEIAKHILGAGQGGSAPQAATINDILVVLNNGPKTIAAIQKIIDDVKSDYKKP